MLGLSDLIFTALMSLLVGSKLPYIEQDYREIVAFIWILVVLLLGALSAGL